MTTWTSPAELPPPIELLVRRWGLPMTRVPALEGLLAAQAEGGTAYALSGYSPAEGGWGQAVQPAADGSALIVTPLVLRSHAGGWYLQAWRYFSAEETIARELLSRAALVAAPNARPAATIRAELGNEVNERQAEAISRALHHRLALITGGPGTGKTHTLARLLALLISEHDQRDLTIHLAAPTGKAAERMKEAVEAAADHLPPRLAATTSAQLKATAQSASTLHKLLGYNPATGRCRFDANNPLLTDVLIVDECSMVDTLLWQALLKALRPDARLILVGDPHQLESVAAGDVLGSIVRFATAGLTSPTRTVWVELTESLRFRDRTGIGGLARSVIERRADDAIKLLEANRPSAGAALPDSGLSWLGDHPGRFSWELLPASVRAAVIAIADARTPKEALHLLNDVRLLTAHREHALGAAGLNESIQRHLREKTPATRPVNEPIIVNRNDPETGLTNGSVGIILEVDGVRAAYFPAANPHDEPRRVLLGQLPDYSPAWAMTIHRSQGSEFDQVVVVLPAHDSPLATRELIYTAITRARRCVHVLGSEAQVRAAIGSNSLRCTLLEASLMNGAQRVVSL